MHGHPIDIWTVATVLATVAFAWWSIKYLPGMAHK